jgi:hypothetical protein
MSESRVLTVVALAIYMIKTGGAKPLQAVQDDFATPQPERWGLTTNSDMWQGYENGRLVIIVKKPNMTTWIPMQVQFFQDFDVSIQTAIIDGPKDNLYGVIFRYQDADNFYYFGLSGTGNYLLVKRKLGKWVNLLPSTRADFVNGDKNQIRLKVSGKRIQAFVNGVEAVNFMEQDSPKRGTIAMSASTLDEAGTYVAFDDLQLTILDR